MSHQRNGPGRPANELPSPLEIFVANHLEHQGITRTQLAEELRVSASTITRLFQGKIHEVESFTADDLISALRLDTVKRRQFLRLIADASISFLLKQPKLAFDFTPEILDGYAQSLSFNLERGHPAFVYEKAGAVFQFLEQRYPESTDPQVVKQIVKFGLLKANAQEAYFPWYQRASRTMTIHSHLLNQYLVRFPERSELTPEYIRILERRAPLYRELARNDDGIMDFDHALTLALHSDAIDIEMVVTLLRNKAHIYAVLGQERQWQIILEQAAHKTSELSSEKRAFHLGLIAYSRAEGYKRLAYCHQIPPPSALRDHYARKALQIFNEARGAVHNARPAHYLLADVSAAQTLIWLDPDAALLQFAQLRGEVPQLEPALLNKIQRAEQFARERLSRKADNDEILLNLDHR